jgi:hypothetical protein
MRILFHSKERAYGDAGTDAFPPDYHFAPPY